MAGDNFDALRKALEAGPSKGPWRLQKHTGMADEPMHPADDWTVYGADGDSVCFEGVSPNAPGNSALIAACDPATITALLAELDDAVAVIIDADAEIDALKAERDALQAKVEAMEKALNEIASWHDGLVVGPWFDDPASATVARAALAQPTGEKP